MHEHIFYIFIHFKTKQTSAPPQLRMCKLSYNLFSYIPREFPGFPSVPITSCPAPWHICTEDRNPTPFPTSSLAMLYAKAASALHSFNNYF